MTPTEAEQAWLALEHEAVWLYPVLGARFEAVRERATSSFTAHRDTRDDLLARLRAHGDEPVVAALTYDSGPLTSADEARAAARTLETAISAATLTLAGATEGAARTYAVTALTTSALAELSWGADLQAFPGLP